MNTPAQRLALLVFSLIGLFLLSACEGGKNKATACNTNTSEPYQAHCKPTGQQCPANQVYIGGKCQTNTCPTNHIPKNGVCVAACEDQYHLEGNTCVENSISIEVVRQEACRVVDENGFHNGFTQIIMQFIARDDQGVAIDPELDNQNQATVITSEILIDGEPANIESLISLESKLLDSNMVLSLVLDSSLSMVEAKAFEPMKQAAISILKDTQRTWSNTESEFIWELVWFNQFLNRPALNNEGEPWAIEDIAKIQDPLIGTELYKAIDYMIGVHTDYYNNGTADQDRDQHVMIVLSDGADTHSTFDNRSYEVQKNADETLYWTEFGHPAIEDPADLQITLNAAPKNLRIHVIGLGEDANKDGELEKIAEAGKGQYFYGSTAKALEKVFEDVQKEFITIQTLGIETSLPTGEHEFTLQTKHNVTNAEGHSVTSLKVNVGSGLKECAPP